MPRLIHIQDIRLTAEGSQPPGYQLVRRGRLQLGLLTLLSLLALPVALILFALLSAPLGGPLDLRHGQELHVTLPGLLLVVLASVVILPVLHELVHGLVAWWCGGKPVYGLGPGVAFCHFRELVSKRVYAAILLAPLCLISIIGLALMPLTPELLRGPLLALLVTNASGAVGDLSALLQLRGLPATTLIADTREGFEAYGQAAS